MEMSVANIQVKVKVRLESMMCVSQTCMNKHCRHLPIYTNNFLEQLDLSKPKEEECALKMVMECEYLSYHRLPL